MSEQDRKYESAKDIFHHIMEFEQRNREHQQQILELLTKSILQHSRRPSLETVKPDAYDGSSSANAQAWLSFYEYACGQNGWRQDLDKVMNMRLYLRGIAKTWHDLRITERGNRPWAEWRDSFLTSFSESKLQSWDRAIAFKYSSGPLVEYFLRREGCYILLTPRYWTRRSYL